MNWNIKISYKATNKTKTQTFLNIKRTRKQKKKTNKQESKGRLHSERLNIYIFYNRKYKIQ